MYNITLYMLCNIVTVHSLVALIPGLNMDHKVFGPSLAVRNRLGCKLFNRVPLKT